MAKVWIPNCDDLREPCCFRFIVKEGADYNCSNEDCIAQTFQRLKHFAKVMDIKGLGDSTLAALMTGQRKGEKVISNQRGDILINLVEEENQHAHIVEQ